MSARTVIDILEVVGLYVFATSGALMAIHKRFDVVGIVVLALLTALGGGILRDLIIGDTPPAAFTNVNYLVIPLVASVVTFFIHPVMRRLAFTVLVFDAAGLGLFCVTSTRSPRRPARSSSPRHTTPTCPCPSSPPARRCSCSCSASSPCSATGPRHMPGNATVA